MVVILPVIESDEFELSKLLNFRRGRVDHPVNLTVAMAHPGNDEEIREHLAVKHHNWGVTGILNCIDLGIRLEFHSCNSIKAQVRLVRAFHCKSQNLWLHVGHIVHDTGRISIIQNLLDEVNRWFSRRMNLFADIPLDHLPD